MRGPNWLLNRLELRGASPAAEFCPVFVLGPPRSGTTLLYQLMIEAFQVGYLSNVHELAFGGPSILERSLRVTRWGRPSNFESDLGQIRGMLAPSECGAFWYRFFPRQPQHVTVSSPGVDRNALEAAVRRFVAACARPVVFKNVVNSVRAAVLAQIFADARFVIVERDLRANAASILRARHAMGSLDRWWSAEPSNVEDLKTARPALQVIGQIEGIKRDMAVGLQHVVPGRIVRLDYDQICGNTHDALRTIADAFALDRSSAAIPAAFPRRSLQPIDPPDLAAELSALRRARDSTDA